MVMYNKRLTTNIKRRKEKAEEEEEGTAGMTEGQREKKRMMDKMAGQQKPTDSVKRKKGERIVDDPVTGQKVVIKDANFKGMFLINSAFPVIYPRFRFP